MAHRRCSEPIRLFKNHVKPVTDISEKRKVYVIISDAFRFEAAHELTQQLNGTPRTQASLSTQLGVLPSYTALGMASLLPHQELSYQDGSSPAVMVDGKSTAGISARDDILNQVNGMALRAEELMAMRKDDARSAAGRQVVYIYHNVIDATGDTSSTEDQTPQFGKPSTNWPTSATSRTTSTEAMCS